MTKVTNNGRNPAVVHTLAGSKVVLPGASIEDEFSEAEIKSMKSHPDYDVGGKGKKSDKDDVAGLPPMPGMPGLGNQSED